MSRDRLHRGAAQPRPTHTSTPGLRRVFRRLEPALGSVTRALLFGPAVGVMVGTQSFPALAAGQVVATAALLAGLRRAHSLTAVWWCFWLFNGVPLPNVLCLDTSRTVPGIVL